MRFELHQPTSVTDALALAQRLGDDARFLSGGTDIVIQMRRGKINPHHLIDLSQSGLSRHIGEKDGRLHIGAAVTHKQLETSLVFRDELKFVAEAASYVGGHQVRNVATIGGNLANASPAADVVPVLLALDAVLLLESASGRREVAVADFLLGPGKTSRRPDEMLIGVEFSKPPAATGSAFLKHGRRRAMEISVVCIAAMLSVEKGRIVSPRIALGSVAPTTIRSLRAEAYLTGKPPEVSVFAEAARIAAEDCSPISEVRASAEYRRDIVAVLVRRALSACAARATGGEA